MFDKNGIHEVTIDYLQNFEMNLRAFMHIYIEENQIHFNIFNDESEEFLDAFDLCHDKLEKIMFTVDGETFYSKCAIFSYSVDEIILMQKGIIVSV